MNRSRPFGVIVLFVALTLLFMLTLLIAVPPFLYMREMLALYREAGPGLPEITVFSFWLNAQFIHSIVSAGIFLFLGLGLLLSKQIAWEGTLAYLAIAFVIKFVFFLEHAGLLSFDLLQGAASVHDGQWALYWSLAPLIVYLLVLIYLTKDTVLEHFQLGSTSSSLDSGSLTFLFVAALVWHLAELAVATRLQGATDTMIQALTMAT